MIKDPWTGFCGFVLWDIHWTLLRIENAFFKFLLWAQIFANVNKSSSGSNSKHFFSCLVLTMIRESVFTLSWFILKISSDLFFYGGNVKLDFLVQYCWTKTFFRIRDEINRPSSDVEHGNDLMIRYSLNSGKKWNSEGWGWNIYWRCLWRGLA